MRMATEDEILAPAQKVCAADGRGIRVIGTFPVGQGHAVNISVPKQPGMSDEDWHSIVLDIRQKLELIPGITRVTIEVARDEKT